MIVSALLKCRYSCRRPFHQKPEGSELKFYGSWTWTGHAHAFWNFLLTQGHSLHTDHSRYETSRSCRREPNQQTRQTSVKCCLGLSVWEEVGSHTDEEVRKTCPRSKAQSARDRLSGTRSGTRWQGTHAERGVGTLQLSQPYNDEDSNLSMSTRDEKAIHSLHMPLERNST